MRDLFSNRTFRSLFLAQVAALLGTGLLTVALGLLAYELAGDRAALVLGTAFTIKMVAYVGLSPLLAALAQRLPRRPFLIALDLIRAGVALAMPFVTEVWQVYVLVFLLQAASAGFTPAFQATIPDILTDEASYTRALSLSRLAYDLENIASPALAAALLAVLPFTVLFTGTMAGFLISAALIVSVTLPDRRDRSEASFAERVTRGLRIYLATPRLRGLLALNLAAAAAGAMVLVNTVVIVRAGLGLGEPQVAIAMGAFGAGSMAAALALPRLLEAASDRPVMLAGAALMLAGLLGLALAALTTGFGWTALLALWAAIGVGYSAVLTPSGRLLRRSSQPSDRPAVFAAQFALSHACWLVAYPLAGVLMTYAGAGYAAALLAALGMAGVLAALRLWPASDPEVLPHSHPDLPADHPHLKGEGRHAHAFTIDALHHEWPRQG